MMQRILAALAVLGLVLPVAAGQRFGLTTIPVGGKPEALLHVPALGLLLVAVPGERRVALVDVAADAVVGSFATGVEPRFIALDAGRTQVLVVGPDRLERYRPEGSGLTLAASADLAPGELSRPLSVAFDPLYDRYLVTDDGNPWLGEIHPVTLEVRRSDTRTEKARQVVVADRLIVPGGELGWVTVVDRESLVPQALLDNPGRGMAAAYSRARDRVYVLGEMIPWVYVADLATGGDGLAPAGEAPGSVVVDEGRDKAYIGHHGSFFITRIDGATLASRSIPIPVESPTVVLDSAASLLYTVSPITSRVSVIDTATDLHLATFAVGNDPRHSTLAPEAHKFYTSNARGGTVSSLQPLADTGGSEIWAAPEGIPADDVSASLITVLPRDASGNPLGPGHDVVIETTAGRLVGSVDYLGDGKYAQELQSSTTVETAIVSATVDGVRLESTPRVSFQRSGWADLRGGEPEWGLTSGGEVVTLHGWGFEGASRVEVYFDGVPAIQVDSFTDTEITCATPPHAAGVVDISVVRTVDGERRESFLRGGFTYVEDGSLQLFATEGDDPGEVNLRWSAGLSGPVRLLQSTSPDFTSGVNEVTGLTGPGVTDLAPAALTFYRVER